MTPAGIPAMITAVITAVAHGSVTAAILALPCSNFCIAVIHCSNHCVAVIAAVALQMDPSLQQSLHCTVIIPALHQSLRYRDGCSGRWIRHCSYHCTALQRSLHCAAAIPLVADGSATAAILALRWSTFAPQRRDHFNDRCTALQYISPAWSSALPRWRTQIRCFSNIYLQICKKCV